MDTKIRAFACEIGRVGPYSSKLPFLHSSGPQYLVLIDEGNHMHPSSLMRAEEIAKG